METTYKGNFSAAFKAARKDLGAGKVFVWNGKRYNTSYANEVSVKNSNSKGYVSDEVVVSAKKPKPFTGITDVGLSTSNVDFSTLATRKRGASMSPIKSNIPNFEAFPIPGIKKPDPKMVQLIGKDANMNVDNSKRLATPHINIMNGVKASVGVPDSNKLTVSKKDISIVKNTPALVKTPLPTTLPNDVKEIVNSKKQNPSFKTFKGKYYVLSKEDGNMYAFNNSHSLIGNTPVGRGKTKGDFPNGENIQDILNHKAKGTAATTRAGSGVLYDFYSDEYVKDYGGHYYPIRYNDGGNDQIGMHQIYPPEFAKRSKIINDKNIVDKLVSNGCINVPKEFMVAKDTKPSRGDSIFITKEPVRELADNTINSNIVDMSNSNVKKHAFGGKVSNKEAIDKAVEKAYKSGKISKEEWIASMLPSVEDSTEFVKGYRTNLPIGKVLPFGYAESTTTPFKEGFMQKQVNTGNLPKRIFVHPRNTEGREWAWGTKIMPKVNGGDVAAAGAETGAGILAGMGMGATLGSVVPGLGTVIGGVVGGLAGLAKGIIGARGRSQSRANALEANRQTTMENMDSRLMADSANPVISKATGFYMKGGILRRHVNGAMIPIASDAQVVDGPSHAGGGVDVTPTDEVEGGEVMQQEDDGTRVFSDRLLVPGTKLTFADAAAEILRRKGALEKSLQSNEDEIAKYRKETTNTKNDILKINSAKRRAQIGAIKSDEVIAQIVALDNASKELFDTQQQINGNAGDGGSYAEHGRGAWLDGDPAAEQAAQEADYMATASGNGINYKGLNSNLGVQFGADMLDTVAQTIIAGQMSKQPVPTRKMLTPTKFNTYVDNSEELNDIDSQSRSTIKFITDNTRGASTRRANIIAMMNRVNAAKNSSYFNKGRMERDLENRNVMLSNETEASNNDARFYNNMFAYNADMASGQRYSGIAANFADKIANLGVARAEQDVNAMSLAAILAQYPSGVRKGIINSMRQGKSIQQALMTING